MVISRLRWALGVGLAAVLTLSSCGSDEESAGNGDGPIKVMTIATLSSPQLAVPEIEDSVAAAVKSINDAGGIDGREIEMSFCNDGFDPNEAAACARKAVDDGVVAVIGGTTVYADSILPVLEQAKIPWIATTGTSGTVELTSDISFPLTAGAPGLAIAQGAKPVELGGPKVVIIASDTESSLRGSEDAQKGVESAGGTSVEIKVAVDAVDYSAAATQALDADPDAVVITTLPPGAPRAVQALGQAGYTGLITSNVGVIPDATIEALGDDANGIVLAGRTAPASEVGIPQVKQFQDELQAESPDAAISDSGLITWAATHFLVAVLEGKSVGGPDDVIDALTTVDAPIELGVAPDYVGIPDNPPNSEYPRAGNFQATVSTVVDGDVKWSGEFFDPLDIKG